MRLIVATLFAVSSTAAITCAAVTGVARVNGVTAPALPLPLCGCGGGCACLARLLGAVGLAFPFPLPLFLFFPLPFPLPAPLPPPTVLACKLGPAGGGGATPALASAWGGAGGVSWKERLSTVGAR